MFKSSKILVLGGSGLLGSALIKKLRDDAFDNILAPNHLELDLTDSNAVMAYFKTNQPDTVFLCAARVGGIIDNKTYPVDYLNTNLKIQLNCFEASFAMECKSFVFYGSSCMYPKNSEQPIKEEYLFDGKIEETSQGYASAKIAGITACKSYNIQYPNKCRYIALIPNSMFGPNDNFNLSSCHVLSALIKRFHDAAKENQKEIFLWGSGEPRREFIFAEDVAAASIFAVNNIDSFENMHYNIGSGIDFSIKELANKIADIFHYKGKILWDTSKPDGTYRKLLDSTRFKSFKWQASHSFDDALRYTCEWYMNNLKEK